MRLRQRASEAQLALMLLTRLPAGRLPDPAPDLAAARWAYPFVGAIVSLAGWLVHQLSLGIGLAPAAAALAAFAAMAFVTGALHHDGLADFADGIGGGRDRAHRLEIMRDSRIGSYGALALIFAVGLPVAAVAGMARVPLAAFLLAGVASRFAMLGVIEALPPARGDGLGRMTGGRDWRHLVPGALLCLAIATLVGAAGWAALVAVAATAAAIAITARRKLGGQTGDVLGATQIACEGAGWLALAALLA